MLQILRVVFTTVDQTWRTPRRRHHQIANVFRYKSESKLGFMANSELTKRGHSIWLTRGDGWRPTKPGCDAFGHNFHTFSLNLSLSPLLRLQRARPWPPPTIVNSSRPRWASITTWTSCWWVCCHRYAWSWRIPRSPGGWSTFKLSLCRNPKCYFYYFLRDLFRKRSIRKSKRRACSPLSAGCLNANTPLGPLGETVATPPGSAQSRWVTASARELKKPASNALSILAAPASIVDREHPPAWKSRVCWAASGRGTPSLRAARTCMCSKRTPKVS